MTMAELESKWQQYTDYLANPEQGIEEQWVRDQLRKTEEKMMELDNKPKLLIKRRGDLLDVFSGVGYNHTLFKIENSKINYVSGFKLTNEEFTYLRENYKHVG